MFERLAIDMLRECGVSFAADMLGISWDEGWRLMERAVARGQARKEEKGLRRIGVDEEAAAKGHKYLTLVCDLDEGTVEYVSEDRKQQSLEAHYDGLTPMHREGIEAVAMDMWDRFVAATKAKVPGAVEKIVFDRYHVMTHVWAKR